MEDDSWANTHDTKNNKFIYSHKQFNVNNKKYTFYNHLICMMYQWIFHGFHVHNDGIRKMYKYLHKFIIQNENELIYILSVFHVENGFVTPTN